MRNRASLVAALLALMLSVPTLWASDFLTEGVDAARTGWVKDEKIFNTTNVGSMKLLWKIKLPSTPREMHNLFAPLIAERVNTPQGVREVAVVAGVSDDLFGIAVATAFAMPRGVSGSGRPRRGSFGRPNSASMRTKISTCFSESIPRSSSRWASRVTRSSGYRVTSARSRWTLDSSGEAAAPLCSLMAITFRVRGIEQAPFHCR